MQIELLQVPVAGAERFDCGGREPIAKPAELRPRPGAEGGVTG